MTPCSLLLLASTALSAPDEAPSYQRHVSAIFSRLGCNGGTCHGAVQGQNGFKLSLFGGDTAADLDRLLRENAGRRVIPVDPEASLLLLKATGRVSHQGGKRCDVGSFEYRVLRGWIAAGAVADAAAPSRVAQLRVTPSENVVVPQQKYQLRVEAQFADGSTEDVTRYCSFATLDAQVAKVDSAGTIEGAGVGDTAVMVRYRSAPALSMVLVPRTGAPVPTLAKAHNFIDEHVLKKLARMNLPPSELADDATFLRRAHLDVTGDLPEPPEVRAFLADRDPQKRQKLIDVLLRRPGHTALWTLKFCDLLKASDYGVYADALSTEMDAPRFQAWIRARLEENLPYDQLVERILLATSREGRSLDDYAKEVVELMEGYGPEHKDLEVYKKRRTLDLYWQRKGSEGVAGALQVAHAFLGLRLECAQCHRHPHDVWQQDDFLSFANFFMRVRRVGFQGETEKKYPEKAAINKSLTDESKKLERDVKTLKEAAKKWNEETNTAKNKVGKLGTEAAKLAKQLEQLTAAKDPGAQKAREQLGKTRADIKDLNDVIARIEKQKRDLAQKEKRSRDLVEAGRRLLHAEALLMPPGTMASITNPLGTQTSKHYRLLGQAEELTIPADHDPRAAVMAWMRRPDNPFFAKAIVNRVWAHYFGRGIIDPPDHLSPFNPATHLELLKELCDGFIANKFDLRWLHRTILQSRTYQQSSVATKDNLLDRGKNYAYFAFRRLPAEVLVDALSQATGVGENMEMKFFYWPESLKTIEAPYQPKNGFVTFMLQSFGKPGRNSAVQCDCERDGNISVYQTLTLANHPRIWEKIADPKGRVARLLKENITDDSRLDDLFLASVSRLPDNTERQACRQFLQNSASAAEGYQGILWGLLNTREFLLQH